jgi:hypothetical protein
MIATIDSLGDCCFQSNLHQKGAQRGNFKDDSDQIVCDVQRKHAVILVAEGAGQQLLTANSSETDASGNRRLGDIGLFLHDEIKRFFSVSGPAHYS